MALTPAQMGAQFQKAFEAFNNGDLTKAENINRKLLKLAPNHPDLTYLAGIIAHSRKQVDRAEGLFRKSLSANPNNPGALSGLGYVLRDRGQYDEALVQLQRATQFAGKDPAIWNGIGITLHDIGQSRKGAEILNGVIRDNPRFGPAFENLGRLYVSTGDLQRAKATLESGLDVDPASVDMRKQLLIVKHQIGTDEDVITPFKELAAQNPSNSAILGGLVLLLIDEGLLDEALKFADQALRIDKNNFSALAQKLKILSALGKSEEGARTRERLIRYSKPVSDAVQHQEDWRYARAEAYENLKNYDAAFEEYTKANILIRDRNIKSGKGYNAEIFENVKSQIASHHTAFQDRLEELSRIEMLQDYDQQAIFVMGMPRSGTTLLEQILAAHPNVGGAGELTWVGDYAERLSTPDKTWVDAIFKLKPDELRKMGQDYLLTAPARVHGKPWMVDKMPENFWQLGLILSIFPNAKIIHSKRNPMDTCLSLYFQQFSNVILYSANLDDLARHYRLYHEMMDIWSDIYGSRIFQNQYEELTGDFEAGCRSLLDHVGLEWDDAVLRFNKSGNQVKTASKFQVRQKVYKTSVEKWRRYEAQLMPLYEQIKDLT